ncbi:riboflavin biosynthesis pyrimidine reductase [Glaciihabitans tibetensis]|uniref:Riboflavin biosynthesis pyrimidine reductase n=1 Tax=Glaciihabitans tibetensis TaxID=1266600 RepID=A0A2T0VJP3_9MICO|nr:dihydrofolate reductase family protein [Glaciihabitans tibetensis]PRY70335.1 riboflavin biosynthesis pyrimidine reductase [Glaciihabitans tibetensis]
MSLTRVFPAENGLLDLADAAEHDRLVDLYRPPRAQWLRLNLIGSVSGSAAGVDGTSETLTNATDRMILRIIRDLSDVVLVGAASVRAEGYFVPRHAALAVVTGSGDLAGHRIRSGEDRGALLVVCPASAVSTVTTTLGETKAAIIVVPDDNGRMEPRDIVDGLRAGGYQSIVCEGGPGLAAQCVNAGLVDEFCLTTSPVLNGAALPLFGGHEFAERRLTLTQLLSDEASFLYGRWALQAH